MVDNITTYSMDAKKNIKKRAQVAFEPRRRKLTPFGIVDYDEIYERLRNDPAYQYVMKNFNSQNSQDEDTKEEK